MLKKNILKFLLGATLTWSFSTWGASFDCNIAARPIEKTICSDQELSSLDEKLNISYQSALIKNPEIKFSQREWLKALSQCNSDSNQIECLRKAFRARIQVLNHIANPSVGTLGIEILGLYRINGQNGLQVGNVTTNGSGYNAGILAGDFIVEINNKKIDDINQVMEQLSIAPGQSVLLKIIKKDNSERVIQVKMGSKADVTTQPALEQGQAQASSGEKNNNQNETAGTNPSVEPSNKGAKPAEKKVDLNADSNSSGNMGWLAALIASLGAAYYYFKKQKTKDTKPAYTQNAKPQENTAQPKVAKPNVQAPSKPPQEPPKELTKEERLKQQQLNAFKNLK
jgi:uncharacterized protein